MKQSETHTIQFSAHWNTELFDFTDYMCYLCVSGLVSVVYKDRVTAKRTYKRFGKKLTTFARGYLEQTILVVFYPVFFQNRTYTWRRRAQKDQRNPVWVPSFFCKTIYANLQMPTKVNLKNDVISRRVRQFPSRVIFFQNLFIYKITSTVLLIKFLLTCITLKTYDVI